MRRSFLFMLVCIMFLPLMTPVWSQDEFFTPTTTIGGYGELHYNYSKMESQDSEQLLDFHRFIIYYAHAWTEKWSLKSEVELEHNLVGDGQGELELEQAYIDYHHSDAFGFRAGVLLTAAGLINEFHEPPLFLSVERPAYNKYIIPTTWFGNGAGIYGRANGFSYRLNVMEGLDGSAFSAATGIRGGREKGYKANAEALLYNAALDYRGLPGTRIGVSVTTNNAVVNDSVNNAINLMEFHAQYEAHHIFAAVEFGNLTFDNGPVETARGFYVDLGYEIGHWFNQNTRIMPWLRYTDYNTAAVTQAGGNSQKANHHQKWLVGIAVKPIPQVVFKVDYGVDTIELNDQSTTLFNLGAGYMF
ncbi:MAG: hypothetical protein GF313_15355 [Caldithrix sp.]|nr:hypothetical protein [Caldithrix sp.]